VAIQRFGFGREALYALTPGKGIVAHREPHGVSHTYVALSKLQERFECLDFADPKAVKTRVAAELEGWAPELTALIAGGEAARFPKDPFAPDRTSVEADFRCNSCRGRRAAFASRR